MQSAKQNVPRIKPTKSDLSKEIQSYLPRLTLNLPFPHESTDGTAIRHDAQLQGTLPFKQNLLKNVKCTLDSATVDVM